MSGGNRKKVRLEGLDQLSLNFFSFKRKLWGKVSVISGFRVVRFGLVMSGDHDW